MPCPVIITQYNRYMGGVDKSDQLLSYHNILRKTVRYWKTPFYNLIDVSIVNAFVLYNLVAVEVGLKPVSENDFRDQLMLQIICQYGSKRRESKTAGRPPRCEYRVKHGSHMYPAESKARCQCCRLQGSTNWTQRKCPDCPFMPALCQTLERDCHKIWHLPSFDEKRAQWFARQSKASSPSSDPVPKPSKRGRPKGSVNRRRRRGAYRSK